MASTRPGTIPIGARVPMPLAGETLRFGRDAANEVVLPSRSVSRFHAEIIRQQGQYVLKDWDSHNGTYVNGKPVQSAPLSDGDVIEIGTFQFRVDDSHLERIGREAPASSAHAPARVGQRLPRTRRTPRVSGRLLRQDAAALQSVGSAQIVELRTGTPAAQIWFRYAGYTLTLLVLVCSAAAVGLSLMGSSAPPPPPPSQTVEIHVRGHLILPPPGPGYRSLYTTQASFDLPEIPFHTSRSAAEMGLNASGNFDLTLQVSSPQRPRYLQLTVVADGYEEQKIWVWLEPRERFWLCAVPDISLVPATAAAAPHV